MVSKEIEIKNPLGLNSKAAALFIHKSSGYRSSIWIEKDERKANAKSLLGLLSLSIQMGESVIIAVEGDDEKTALRELEEYLNNDLGEIG
ncbi:MAG: HPr family phosphocarrier protein [Clostridiales bacterium]